MTDGRCTPTSGAHAAPGPGPLAIPYQVPLLHHFVGLPVLGQAEERHPQGRFLVNYTVVRPTQAVLLGNPHAHQWRYVRRLEALGTPQGPRSPASAAPSGASGWAVAGISGWAALEGPQRLT